MAFSGISLGRWLLLGGGVFGYTATMSRYDRQRERKRLLIVVCVVAVFGGAFIWWGSHANGSLAGLEQETSTKR